MVARTSTRWRLPFASPIRRRTRLAAASLGAIGLVGALAGQSASAGAAPVRPAAPVIDTTRVVGFEASVVHSVPRAPSVTVAPRNQAVLAGVRVRFTAAAIGSPAPTVRWQQSSNGGTTWRNIAGATGFSYAVRAAATLTGHRYRAIFTNSVGSARTRAARLTVLAPVVAPPTALAPMVTLQPVSVTVAVGAAASFSATASGTPTPTVQWQLSINGGTSWSVIAGATSSAYSLATTTAQNSGELLEAVFSNTAGSVTTTAATLTVTPPPGYPVITAQPTSEIVPQGTTASFTSTATGTPPPTVQWQYSANSGASWSPFPGGTSTTILLSAQSIDSGYEFEAVFTNSVGTATSNAATLTVSGAVAESRNWSGYVDSGAVFTSVGSSWRVPAVTCATGESDYSAQWIGIDGGVSSSSSVEQDGADSDCDNGSPNYYAWYEMYGDQAVNQGDSVELSPASYPVAVGDLIAASVSYTGGTWTLAVSDATANWHYSAQFAEPAPAPAQASAEWIVERPEVCSGANNNSCSLNGLPDFGSVGFMSSSVSVGGANESISSFSNQAVDMAEGASVLAVVNSLDPTGTVFTDTWQANN